MSECLCTGVCVCVYPPLLCATSPALWLPSGFTPSECHPPKPSLLQTWQERSGGGVMVVRGVRRRDVVVVGLGGGGCWVEGAACIDRGDGGQSLKLTSQFH